MDDGEAVVLGPHLAIDVAGLRRGHVDLRHVQVELGGNRDVERQRLRRDDVRRAPRDAAVERPVERDRVRRVVVPRDVHLAVRSDERIRADRAPGAARIVDAEGRERRAVTPE